MIGNFLYSVLYRSRPLFVLSTLLLILHPVLLPFVTLVLRSFLISVAYLFFISGTLLSLFRLFHIYGNFTLLYYCIAWKNMALSECYLTKAIHCTITLHLAYTSIRARALRVSYATGVFFFLLFFFVFFVLHCIEDPCTFAQTRAIFLLRVRYGFQCIIIIVIIQKGRLSVRKNIQRSRIWTIFMKTASILTIDY